MHITSNEVLHMPIRILQVVTYMGRGGLETMLMNYYRQIDRSRVQFDFLVHRGFHADYDDEIEALGGRIYRLPRLVPWSRSYQNALNAFFAEHPEYRIVHVHQDCLSGVILKAAQRNGIPVRIAHSHSSGQDKDLKYPIKLFYRCWIPRYATELLACSREAGEWMFRGAEFGVLNNAVDAAAYRYDVELGQRMREELKLKRDDIVVGHVGRFSPAKNHAGLLEIFAAVRGQEPRAKLLLVGDGELRGEIEAKIAALGLSDSVLLTGVRSDVPALLQAMDVFVFPSHYEGLPVTLVEAQAAGLPCLISDRVPMECKLTELVQQLPLECGAEAWAERILAAAGTPRTDPFAQIAAAGYDIAQNAERLQNHYLEQWKAND